MKEKIKLKLIELDRNLILAQEELNNENATLCTTRKCHVEILEIKSNINLLNQLLYEDEKISGTDSAR